MFNARQFSTYKFYRYPLQGTVLLIHYTPRNIESCSSTYLRLPPCCILRYRCVLLHLYCRHRPFPRCGNAR